ncbi:MAG TPA: cob(I)yrinic acid a,c-diamide adenosyltransferase [Thermoplasmataceae archaeon]|nr:cob(I)yrinic acid a,c-diamide adenosyltransferase [Thermoplasmatales archaeon AK]HLH85344.1 cob(I)yrinic acid a,c-diamide adenosyltransferase [Thermoplasmataceae archaeon]
MSGLSRGLIEVYTGTGKGKTTAAFGLALRALGWGLKVYVLQFMKLGTYGENRISPSLGENLRVDYAGMPYFIAWDDEIPAGDRDRVKNVLLCKRDSPPEEYIRKVSSAFSSMKEELLSGRWDVVILDEINVALYYKLISIKDVRELMDSKPEKVELVFTGRNIPEEIISRANLVSEIREVKHPYSSGVPARRGIDF